MIEDEVQREQAPTIGYYAMFEYTNGFKKALYWSKEKMKAHAVKYSQGYANDLRKGTAWTFWSKDFDGMAMKTMLRQLISKWGVMSIDMTTAMETDMAMIKPDLTPEYVDTEEVPQQAPQDQLQEPAQPAQDAAEPEPAANPSPSPQKPQETPQSGPAEKPRNDVAAALFGNQ